MKQTMRIAASATAVMMVLAAALASPVAGSVPQITTGTLTYDMHEFFPMAIGNSWQWVAAEHEGNVKRMSIVDQMHVKGHTVWVAELDECVRGETQTAGVTYFVEHEDGLFATQFLDSLMDWSHDTDDTAMLQRWTTRTTSMGTHAFNRGGVAQAYTVALEDGVPAIRVHDAAGEKTYQRYVYGIGPVARGNFELQRATVGGIEYVL